MIKSVNFCDRCGKMIEGNRFFIYVGATNVNDYSMADCNEFEGIHGKDFCGECIRKMIAPIPEPEKHESIEDLKNKLFHPEKVAAPEVPEKKVPSNYKDLDVGMIVSLRDAGWTWDKIQKEIKSRQHIEASKQTIANRYYEEKDRRKNAVEVKKSALDDIEEPTFEELKEIMEEKI